eukprot:202891-Pyramimonas_sp.AAC.1
MHDDGSVGDVIRSISFDVVGSLDSLLPELRCDALGGVEMKQRGWRQYKRGNNPSRPLRAHCIDTGASMYDRSTAKEVSNETQGQPASGAAP